MKIFQVHIEYLEPTEAIITLYAESEEEAINIVRKQVADNMGEITIKGIEELHDLPSIGSEDVDPNRKIN